MSLYEWALAYLRGLAEETHNPDSAAVRAWTLREANALSIRLSDAVEAFCSHEMSPLPEEDNA